SIFWKGMTTRGAFIGGLIGLVVSIMLVVLGPAVWVDVFKFETPIFPWSQYALFSMATTFGAIWLFSVTDKSARAALDKAGYGAQFVRSETGLGAAGAVAH
ncbi:cation/acetate symporter, partial [Rhodobacter capsulatus]